MNISSDNSTDNTIQPASASTGHVVVIPTSALTWAKTSIKSVSYNTDIQAHIDHNLAFKNWIRSAVMLVAENGIARLACTLPDQFRADVGDQVIIEMVSEGKIKVYA